MASLETIRRMQAIRRLARVQPVALLEKRLAEIAEIAKGEPVKKAEAKPAEEPPAVLQEEHARHDKTGRNRMEKSGRDR